MTAVGPSKAIPIPPIVRRRVGVNNRKNRDRPSREWRRSAHEPPKRGNDSGDENTIWVVNDPQRTRLPQLPLLGSVRLGTPQGWYQSIRRGSADNLAASENLSLVGYSKLRVDGGFLDLVAVAR
jgi:hypothetical protein